MKPPKGRLAALAAAGVTGAVVLAGALGLGPAASAAPVRQPPAGGEHQRGKWRFDATATSMANVNAIIGANRLHASGVDGSGVGVALVDTGVVPVDGLRGSRLVIGPDLSLEGQTAGLRYADTYGHGTHLAGIIAGTPDGSGFSGVAPGATLTSVKVGAAAGIVDVSQVIAAIDWVVQHRADDPAHPVRVLNLSYGTDSIQAYQIDPLAHAVENAWHAGIVVVAAAGNDGVAAPRLTDPAIDPYVIAVGAADSVGSVKATDDTVADFSSRGEASRRVDLVAPGRSLVSLRDPGSYADSEYPGARVGDRLFKGSGTSQAAAVVSGAVALLLQQRPDLRPDQVKALLTRTATVLPKADAAGRGAGELDVASATRMPTPRNVTQTWPRSTGLGSLEAARGNAHVTLDGTTLIGESDLFGPFDVAAWAAASSAGTSWNGGVWMGRKLTGPGWADVTSSRDGSGLYWSGLSWSGLSWSGLSWSGLSWSGLSWSGLSWSGLSWSGLSWSGLSWSGLSWSGLSWSGLSWSGLSWSGLSWSGLSWSGAGWSSEAWSAKSWA
jgi:serine protease AprX